MTDNGEKKRHLSIHCPACGYLSRERKFELDHPFPIITETFYGGRGKISHEFVIEDDDATDQITAAVQDKITFLALTLLDDYHKEVLMDKLVTLDA